MFSKNIKYGKFLSSSTGPQTRSDSLLDDAEDEDDDLDKIPPPNPHHLHRPKYINDEIVTKTPEKEEEEEDEEEEICYEVPQIQRLSMNQNHVEIRLRPSVPSATPCPPHLPITTKRRSVNTWQCKRSPDVSSMSAVDALVGILNLFQILLMKYFLYQQLASTFSVFQIELKL